MVSPQWVGASPLMTISAFPFFALGLWNLVFLFSNLSLIFLMPFAYFFTESEGFAGSRKVSPGMYQSINADRKQYSTEMVQLKRF